MPRTNLPWTPSKRGLCRRVGKGQNSPPEGHAHRDMVPGRSAGRPEEQDHPALGQTWDAAIGAKRSEEHTSELQSLMRISYAVFCLKKNKYCGQLLTREIETVID